MFFELLLHILYGKGVIAICRIIRNIYALLMICGILTGCTGDMTYTDTVSEIPPEIWAQMDQDTREALAEGTKYVALTFDDGPRKETTEVLLDGLKQRGVQATFFVIGTQIGCVGNEDLLLRMRDEGHQIGNHTYSHVRLQTARRETILEEIQKNEVIIQEILGPGEYWLRPPYGMIGNKQCDLVKTPMIYWSLDTEDWKVLDAKAVSDLVVEKVRDGDIVLLHDFYPSSVEAALEIIDRLQPEGYVFVTVEELFRIKGITPEAGVLYASPCQIRNTQ